MVKVLRFGFGTLLVALILYAATWAVRDCPAGELVYENCLWMAVRDYLGLAQSKLGRAVTLEIVGLALLAGLYITLRYAVAPLRPRRESQGRDETDATAHPAAGERTTHDP